MEEHVDSGPDVERHQTRWREVLRDPALRDLPYKVETNERGQIVLSPRSARHADLQEAVQNLLRRHAPAGRQPPEYPIATPGGVKQVDVIWASADRLAEMRETGDPPTLAPEICVEVLSEGNTEAEMQEKRQLYFEAGADEVWLVAEDGSVRFFADERLDRSTIAPDFPERVET
jgi:Uma2 family endonuclease